MDLCDTNSLLYKRAHFVTRLPLAFRYSPSHYWLFEQNGIVRVGLTKFATRMLGEIVDYSFDVEPGSTIAIGKVIGWIEGLKAVSDLLCVVDGRFRAHNPLLKQDPEAIARDCYGEGWVYEAAGRPDAQCVEAHDYKAQLDAAIDKLIEKQPPPD